MPSNTSPNTSNNTSNTQQNVNSGQSAQEQESKIESVFELGYVPTSKAVDFNALTTGYFTINDTVSDALRQLGLNKFIPQRQTATLVDGTFWQIIVTEINEEHEEKFALYNTISDNVMVFATGAKPIAITIQGYVLISDTDNYEYLFLRNYVDHFRARHLSANNTWLTFRSQDTSFKLIIESINMSHTIEFETYVAITFSGLAYDYCQTGSTEPLDFSYYGKRRTVPASKREEDKEKKEEAEVEAGKREKPKAPYSNPAGGKP